MAGGWASRADSVAFLVRMGKLPGLECDPVFAAARHSERLRTFQPLAKIWPELQRRLQTGRSHNRGQETCHGQLPLPTSPSSASGSPVRSIGVRCGFLAWAVLALVACSGGGGSTSDPATTGQPAVPTDVDPDVDLQSVTIHVTTSAGSP